MTASGILFGAMAFSAKVASARLPGPEISMLRMSMGLLPVLLVPRFRRSALQFTRPDLIFLRGFFGGVAVLLYFIAIQHTNVGVATLLNYCSPVWSGVFSLIFLSERVSPRVLIPLPIALAGAFLVVHAHAAPGDVLGIGRWELVGALSAVVSGLAVTVIRAARRTENPWSLYSSFCLLGTLVSLPQALWLWKTPQGGEWVAIVATAVLAMGAQLLMTFSLRWVDALTVGVISQLAVVVSTGLGVLLLNESITPGAALGGLLCISGVAGVSWVTSASG